jgi:hypothetical protein
MVSGRPLTQNTTSRSEPIRALDVPRFARQDEEVVLDEHHAGAPLVVLRRDFVGDGLGFS